MQKNRQTIKKKFTKFYGRFDKNQKITAKIFFQALQQSARITLY